MLCIMPESKLEIEVALKPCLQRTNPDWRARAKLWLPANG